MTPSLNYDQFILLGDSLTEKGANRPDGWGLLMVQEYSRKANIVVRGFGSFNTYWLKFAVEPLLRDLPAHRIKLITLMIGTNDFRDEPYHVPLNMNFQFLQDIVRNLHELAPHAHILVLTPPPVCKAKGDVFVERSKEYRDSSLNAIKVVKANSTEEWTSTQLSSLNTWDVFIPNKEYEKPDFDPLTVKPYFEDDVHFSPAGQKKLFDGVVAEIEKIWPHLAAKNMKYVVVDADKNPGPAARLGDDEAVKKWLFGKH
ncbi:SGNH hydrolase [Rhizoclosmatium globosum]|uniref:SGNH hydrolase n=1 Tax=Rhizoclosmatium globosum TaxID=329046 RepID=A0A1Y2CVT4_9FUNG|nr:SGNH hydrolase [Rhizoclosmatium globosum]|eukprot:ORY51087.1 SGNH hydrolase [Rhizoclosmatium globosum]